MQKLVLPAVLAVAFASHAQASWLSEAVHQPRADECRARPVYAAGYGAPRFVYPPNYAPPAPPAPGYAPVTTSNAAPGDPAPVSPAPAYGDRVTDVTDRLASELRTLREDVDVELPDARGRALAAQADDLLEQIEHLQKSVRSGASQEHLQEHAADLAKSLHEFLEATEALGRDGRFLNRSARRIHDLDHYLLKLVGPAGNP